MGHFIFKFLRELNSATSSKMMVLAVVLGLVAGFLPVVNFFTFLIFFIVLIFRIPVGLFLASFSFFEIAGYFLDSVFNKTGLFLLKLSFLKPVWTFFYNLPFIRWSGFNNTIVMGSLILGTALGIVLYFILDKAVKLYRKKIFGKLKANKYLSWLVPDEKKGVIRIAGVGFVGVGIAGFALFFIFLLDPIIKYSLEFIISKTTHKNVRIEKVDTNIKNLSVNIYNMQVGDVLFKKVYTRLAWDKIVWRKYKIDDLEVIANTNKNIFDLIKKISNNPKTEKRTFKLNLKLPCADEFLAKQELKSPKAIEKLKKDYKKIQFDLKKTDIKQYKLEFNNLKSKINLLKNAKIKTPSDLNKLLDDVKTLKKETKKFLKQIKADKNLLVDDKKLIQQDLQNLQTALKEDKKNIQEKYNMIKNKEYMEFTQSLLKPEIRKYVKTFSLVYEKIKPYIHSSQKENEYKRAGGVYVKFADKIKYPDFVLVKFLGNITTSVAKWNLKGFNISDNQSLLSKRAEVLFKGKSKFFDLGGDINYLKDIKFSAYGNKVYIKKLDLNFIILKALADIKTKGVIENNNINSKTFILFYNPKFEVKSTLNIADDLNKIKHFKMTVYLTGKINSPKIKIKSDFKRYLLKIIQNKINKLINKNTKKAQMILDKRVNASLKKLNLKDLDITIKDLDSFKNISKTINKELEEIIKSKQKNILKNSIKKFLSF